MTEKVDPGRRRFLTTATSILGGIGAACVAAPFVKAWLPSAQAQAKGGPVKVDISQLQSGSQITVAWRDQPIWIVRRSKETLSQLKQQDNLLRDPHSEQLQQPKYAQNEYRSIKSEYLVLIGVCTHLGCVPLYRPQAGSVEASWLGGFFCPCHGSKFDLAGRVFKGVPAPLNLQVPPYRYESETVIVIGEGQEAA